MHWCQRLVAKSPDGGGDEQRPATVLLTPRELEPGRCGQRLLSQRIAHDVRRLFERLQSERDSQTLPMGALDRSTKPGGTGLFPIARGNSKTEDRHRAGTRRVLCSHHRPQVCCDAWRPDSLLVPDMH